MGENEQSFPYCKLGRVNRFASLFLMWSPSTLRTWGVSAEKSIQRGCWCPPKTLIAYRRQVPFSSHSMEVEFIGELKMG